MKHTLEILLMVINLKLFILSLYNMKIVRLGMTEAGILVLTFVYRYCNINNSVKQQILNTLMNLVNWLYTTSGYYDNTVPGTKFNFRQDALNANFNKLVQHLEIAVGECEETQMFFHDGLVRNLYEQVKDHFHAFYKINTFVLSSLTNNSILGNLDPTLPAFP